MFQAVTGALPRPAAQTLNRLASELEWQESEVEGFHIAPLYEDAASHQRTWLMRIDPGAFAAQHSHTEQEQIYVLEGQFSDGINDYAAGDFAVRAAGQAHTAYSEHGALVLLVYSK